MKLGDKVRVYRDYWKAKCVLCLPCAEAVGEDNGCTIDFPAYAEGSCEQCGAAESTREE